MTRTRELDHELRVTTESVFVVGACECGGHASTRREPARVVTDWLEHLEEVGVRRPASA